MVKEESGECFCRYAEKLYRTRPEEEYTKTEKWLAKQGIKEDKNKTKKGFRRRKKV